MRVDKYTSREIAKAIGKHHSSICREIRRNRTISDEYQPLRAAGQARARAKRSRKKAMFGKDIWTRVDALIRIEWAPEQISLILREANISRLSFSTIYRHIKADRKAGGSLHVHLRQFRKKRRKKNGSSDSRGVLAGKRGLPSRPPGANNRTRKGHFEIDLMHGKPDKDCILTLVDRQTLYTRILKLKNKSNREVFKALLPVILELNIKSITADNGTEWHGYKDIEKVCKVKFYFAKPYHSWERGTNENTNGLIRQYIPKGQTMKGITTKYCKFIEDRLNHRPRKILNMESPHSLYFGYSFLSRFK
jgi:IS30 family transposase